MHEDREIEKNYALTEFVAELRRLADTLEANERFILEIDGEEILVPENAVASVVYEIEDGRAEIEFQLGWNVIEANDEDDAEAEKDAEASSETEAAH